MVNQKLWGLTLLERNLKELTLSGIEEVLVVTREELQPSQHFGFPLPKALHVSYIMANPVDPFASLRTELQKSGHFILVLEGNSLTDRRILKILLNSNATCGVISPTGIKKGGAAVLSDTQTALFAKTSSQNLTAILSQAIQNSKIQNLNLTNFEKHIVNLRREIDPFLLTVENTEQLNEADRFLRLTVHKGVNDFVAKYIHPPLEFGGTHLLLSTTITPNQVTIFWVLLVVTTIPLFATGHLLLGTILAVLYGILDGIDGKLARLTLRFSKSGALLDHVTDTVYDGLWCLTLGWYFSHGDLNSIAARFTFIFFTSYVVERIVPGIFKKLHGYEIYDYEDIDKVMRLIGSRRNNNIWFLMIGIILGVAREAYYMVSIWMLLTASWHTLRLIWVTWISKVKKPALASKTTI
ncbi:MAG: CDP-alcohol phosphatidyltransferase family protein [bacterium]